MDLGGTVGGADQVDYSLKRVANILVNAGHA